MASVITPILKKGDPKNTENYRPVSCLRVASKVLEGIVNDQTSEYMENGLLPQNQHGFGTKKVNYDSPFSNAAKMGRGCRGRANDRYPALGPVSSL